MKKVAALLEEPICKWSRKQIELHLDRLVSDVLLSPRFVCLDCGRTAASKKNLCQGKKMLKS